MTAFGDAVKERREARNLNQAALARLSKVDPGYLSRLEKGERLPSTAVAKAIDDALKADGRIAALAPLTIDTTPEPAWMTPADNEPADTRVTRDQGEWRRTRTALNRQRHTLSHVAARVYDPAHRLGNTLLAHPAWLPDAPVDLANIRLEHQPDAPHPALDGTEPETAALRPCQTLLRRFPRYSAAIRDLAHPRLFESRLSWRLTGLTWEGDKGVMSCADTTYFAGVDTFEVLAHELALAALDEDGGRRTRQPTLRDLPFRRLIGDPFDVHRRPLLCAISTLTIRRGTGEPTFLLHHRDSNSVAIAGGMLHVIPSGIFQPSSVLPAMKAADFDLWRNIQREYSEELLGNPEHDGDGQPVDYTAEPFATLDQARADGKMRVYCLGVALDALTLVAEVLTVAVIDADVFDRIAPDFVDTNDEGTVVGTRAPFTQAELRRILDSGRMAPAGAGCLDLAWEHREHLLG